MAIRVLNLLNQEIEFEYFGDHNYDQYLCINNYNNICHENS